jgi:hypothetical protein
LPPANVANVATVAMTDRSRTGSMHSVKRANCADLKSLTRNAKKKGNPMEGLYRICRNKADGTLEWGKWIGCELGWTDDILISCAFKGKEFAAKFLTLERWLEEKA